MANSDTDFIFPPRIIPDLRDLRGIEWGKLIDRISTQSPDALERVAFVLTMVRLCGCTTCQADSFKAMRGCIVCATQTIKRFRGEDADLLSQLETAKRELTADNKRRANRHKVLINKMV